MNYGRAISVRSVDSHRYYRAQRMVERVTGEREAFEMNGIGRPAEEKQLKASVKVKSVYSIHS
jgi:hypothetical protein